MSNRNVSDIICDLIDVKINPLISRIEKLEQDFKTLSMINALDENHLTKRIEKLEQKESDK